MIYTHEFRPEPLSDDIRIIAEALETPIEKKGLWIIDTLAETEGKYADFYPQIGLLVLDDNFNLAPVPTPTVSKSDGTSVEDDILSGSSQGLFDLIPDADETDFISDYVSKKGAEEYIKSVLNKDWTVAQPIFNKKLPMHLFNTLTSAKYHHRIMRLFAQADAYYNASPSFIRLSEVEILFDVELPKNGKENFAVDYGQFILYFHMDHGRYGYENIRFNHYRYNNGKDEMYFFDGENDNALLPYAEWKSRLDNKPVIIFGYDERMKNFNIDEPLLKFLGSHENNVDADEQGNYKFCLLNTYDFTI